MWTPFNDTLRGLPIHGPDTVETRLPDPLSVYSEFLFYAYVDIPEGASPDNREFAFYSTTFVPVDGTHVRRLRASGNKYSASITFSLPKPHDMRIKLMRHGAEVLTQNRNEAYEHGLVLLGARVVTPE